MTREYKIIESGHSSVDLTGPVNEAIAEGWEPQGGVAVAAGEDYETWAQAMVKEKPISITVNGGISREDIEAAQKILNEQPVPIINRKDLNDQ